jgi:hypothetical protein
MRDTVTTGMIMAGMKAGINTIAVKVMVMVEAATDMVTVVINKTKLKKASPKEKPFLVYIYLLLTIDL